MDHILTTIIPIFSIVILGAIAKSIGFLPQAFLGPANRLVYYLAIPAMIFRAIANASLDLQADHTIIWVTLLTLLSFFFVCLLLSRILPAMSSIKGAFIQCSFHGNLGYIGLAVAFYHLGAKGLAKASILAAFIMILQNFLSVLVLQTHQKGGMNGGRFMAVLGKIAVNPVILSAIAGIFFSLENIPIPLVVDRSLKILSGLALPMALLIIGGSISFTLMKSKLLMVSVSSVLKLLILPGMGMLLFRLLGQPSNETIPAMILLASPTATIAYVMAREMGADADFAVAAISASTLLSALTFSFWLSIL
jgi:predicted permease